MNRTSEIKTTMRNAKILRAFAPDLLERFANQRRGRPACLPRFGFTRNHRGRHAGLPLPYTQLQTGLIVFFAVIAYCAEGGNGAQAIQLVAQQRAIAAPPDVATSPSDARTTASGVAMKVLKHGRGAERPRDNDCVKVHFTVWQRDGAMLVSSRLRGTAEVQCMQTVFPGVAEALKTMVVREERRFWIPAALAYGEKRGRRGVPTGNLVYDVKLLAIE